MKNYTLATYNINGIRAAMRKGLDEWVGKEQPDILCLQEVKAEEHQVDLSSLEKMGYKAFWKSAEKKGYSGVAVLTKMFPQHVEYNSGFEEYDREGRVLELAFDDFDLFNIYFPSGSSGDHRQDVKMRFLEDILPYLKSKAEKKPLIVGGDFNICHKAVDIHDPVRNAKSSGFLPEERAWMEKLFNSGFTDAFRHIHPDKKDAYSWWSYRANARNNNKGWRIDYWAVSDNLAQKIIDCRMEYDAKHSDHCPVVMEIEIE